VKEHFTGIIAALESLAESYGMPVIFPMHPRTQKMMDAFKVAARGITIVPPTGYLDFLGLEAQARLVLTDSGGVQEEACILNVPCVTLRENTERPETVDAGANVLAGTDTETIVQAAGAMMDAPRAWKNPFGDGKAAERIVKICDQVVRSKRG
jgi:UDP-N-acetylglucosamine 2-epimerase (non-hydrolysing)